jgi:hypothetical protein
VASQEALAVVNCRIGFSPIPDAFYAVIDKCSVDPKLMGKTVCSILIFHCLLFPELSCNSFFFFSEQKCIHRCAYNKLKMIDENGNLDKETIEEVAEKVYKGTGKDILKSRESFVNDFMSCYKESKEQSKYR